MMLVVDLHCAQGHDFEGWFASADDLSSQKARGLLSCPVCGDHDVTRRPSAPHLNTLALREPSSRTPAARPSGDAPSAAAAKMVKPADVPPANAEAQEALAALQALYVQAVRHVIENTEDVGKRFVEEVRSIHHGDAPQRAIRGEASAEDRAELADEGIEVLALPLPDGLKGPLQ